MISCIESHCQLKAEFLQLREISQFKQQEATRRIIILIISNAGGLACTFILTSRFHSRLLFMKIPRDAPSNPTRVILLRYELNRCKRVSSRVYLLQQEEFCRMLWKSLVHAPEAIFSFLPFMNMDLLQQETQRLNNKELAMHWKKKKSERASHRIYFNMVRTSPERGQDLSKKKSNNLCILSLLQVNISLNFL